MLGFHWVCFISFLLLYVYVWCFFLSYLTPKWIRLGIKCTFPMKFNTICTSIDWIFLFEITLLTSNYDTVLIGMAVEWMFKCVFFFIFHWYNLNNLYIYINFVIRIYIESCRFEQYYWFILFFFWRVEKIKRKQ